MKECLTKDILISDHGYLHFLNSYVLAMQVSVHQTHIIKVYFSFTSTTKNLTSRTRPPL